MSPERAPTHRHAVLVVDDEAPIRRSAARELRQTFDVVEAAGVTDALEQLAVRPDVCAVVADLGLLDGSGAALLTEVERRAPWCARVLMSGATTMPAVGDIVVPKPWPGGGILRAVEQALAIPPTDPPADTPRPSDFSVPRTLLFADRSADTLMLLRQAAERRGFRVVEARDGAQAVQLALQHHPDAMVVDLDLPALGGVEVARALGEALPLSERPAVVLSTGRALGSQTLREAIEAGAADCIDRACPLADLFDRIDKHLGPSTRPSAAAFPWTKTVVDELTTMPVRTVRVDASVPRPPRSAS